MIRLTWTDNSNNEARFELIRERSASGTWGSQVLFQVAANATTFDDTVTQPGLYRYQIKAVNAAGASSPTPWVEANLPNAAVPPAAPSNLKVVRLQDRVTAKIDWTDNSNNEASFTVVRQTKSGPSWTNQRTFQVGANVSTYSDRPGNGQHRYQVFASNASGNSASTPWVAVKI